MISNSSDLIKSMKCKGYFVAVIKGRELMKKRLRNKYIASFDYFHKLLIVLSATSDRISIASIATVIGAPVGIASASFSLVFSISTGIAKNIFKKAKQKEKIIKLLARSKFFNISSKISES